MKMLKPVRGPHDWVSMLATSPTALTRRLPPGFGCAAGAPEVDAAGVADAVFGAAAAAPVAAGLAAGGAGAPHAARTLAPVAVISSVNARRRLNCPVVVFMEFLPLNSKRRVSP